jgi:hypothetical protein
MVSTPPLGFGSPVAAAQGKGYLDEWIGRLTHKFPTAASAANLTFDQNSTYFPLNQSLYAVCSSSLPPSTSMLTFC